MTRVTRKQDVALYVFKVGNQRRSLLVATIFCPGEMRKMFTNEAILVDDEDSIGYIKSVKQKSFMLKTCFVHQLTNAVWQDATAVAICFNQFVCFNCLCGCLSVSEVNSHSFISGTPM